MSWTTFIEPEALQNHLGNDLWVVVDCRFSLQEPEWGRNEYRKSHIPGAVYAHLDEDLSGEIVSGLTGRHPFPEPDVFARRLSSWGVSNQSQVVAYDGSHGAIAARLWGLLRWLGHEKAAVLNGGWSAWVSEERPVSEEIPEPERAVFAPDPDHQLLVDSDFVRTILQDQSYLLVDSRNRERYLGEEEPIDPVAGHIPGAVSLPYPGNVNDQGELLPREELRKRFERTLGDHPPEKAIFYCGSGVTSFHNLMVMEHLGMKTPKLYPGSWSAWIMDAGRPVEQGASSRERDQD